MRGLAQKTIGLVMISLFSAEMTADVISQPIDHDIDNVGNILEIDTSNQDLEEAPSQDLLELSHKEGHLSSCRPTKIGTRCKLSKISVKGLRAGDKVVVSNNCNWVATGSLVHVMTRVVIFHNEEMRLQPKNGSLAVVSRVGGKSLPSTDCTFTKK